MSSKNIAQIINEIDQKDTNDYSIMKPILDVCDRSQSSSRDGNNHPPKFINEEEENEIVRKVQTEQRLLM